MKKTVTFLLLLFVANGYSQVFAPKWESCFGGTEWDEGTGIIYSDSSYWIAGRTESADGDIAFNHGNRDLWLLNIDKEGNIISEKTFGGSEYEGSSAKILKLNDSIFYISTATSSDDGDINPTSWQHLSNYWVLQINNKGEILWNRVCGGSDIDNIRDAIVTNDGGIIALGISVSTDGDVTDHHGFGQFDLWLIKLGSNGEKRWTLSLGGIGDEIDGSIIQTIDGGYMVVGDTDGRGGGNYDSTCNFHGDPIWTADVWVVKLDSVGNIEWQQCYGGTYDDYGNNIIELADGYVVLGGTMSNDGDVSGFHETGGSQFNDDIWVFKIDKTGNLLWQKCLGGTYADFARNIFPTSDGGFMIVGTTGSNDGDVVGNHNYGTGYGLHDIWFVKIDSIGNFVWQYCYGGNADEMLYRGVYQKSDWDYVVAIGTTSYDWQCYHSAYPDVRVVELYDSTVGVSESLVGKIKVNIYPNPATSTLNIELPDNPLTNTATVEMLDMNGRVLLKEKFTAPVLHLNTSGLNSGLYLIKVQTAKGVVTDRKSVV